MADEPVEVKERWKEEPQVEVEEKGYDPTQRIEMDRILVIHHCWCCGY